MHPLLLSFPRRPFATPLFLSLTLVASVSAAEPQQRGDGAVREHAALVATARERSGALPGAVGDALLRFYREREGRPAWRRPASWWRRSGPRREAEALIDSLSNADRLALDPDDYRPDALARRLAAADWDDPEDVREIDLALSEAFLFFAADLASGRLAPESLGIEWHTPAAEPDLARALADVFERGVDGVVESLQPEADDYWRLLEALSRYREIAAGGGWPRVGGTDDARALRARLEAEGYRVRARDPAAAVRAFQARHGLDVDGMVGAETLSALDVPAQARAEQIALNVERWRWGPRRLGDRFVLVNIPAFDLELREGARVVLAMPVVVGEVGRRTPVLSDEIESVVLNPYWNVPSGIAAEELAPKIEQEPGFLEEQGYEVVSGWEEDAEVLDPDEVDWEDLADEESGVRLRQRPGPKNSLGRLKLLLPNRLDVYLHDTPADELFEESERDFSHGCIRLARPVELAAALLSDAPAWDEEALREAIEGEEREVIALPEPVAVHLLYWTARIHPDGGVAFYEDVYGIDALQSAALRPAVHGAGGS